MTKIIRIHHKETNLIQNQMVNLNVALEEVRGLRQILSQSMKKISGDGGEVFSLEKRRPTDWPS